MTYVQLASEWEAQPRLFTVTLFIIQHIHRNEATSELCYNGRDVTERRRLPCSTVLLFGNASSRTPGWNEISAAQIDDVHIFPLVPWVHMRVEMELEISGVLDLTLME